MFATIRLEVGALSDKPPLSGLCEKKEHAEDLTLPRVIGDIQSRGHRAKCPNLTSLLFANSVSFASPRFRLDQSHSPQRAAECAEITQRAETWALPHLVSLKSAVTELLVVGVGKRSHNANSYGRDFIFFP